jgi:hypothetical protein
MRRSQQKLLMEGCRYSTSFQVVPLTVAVDAKMCSFLLFWMTAPLQKSAKKVNKGRRGKHPGPRANGGKIQTAKTLRRGLKSAFF